MSASEWLVEIGRRLRDDNSTLIAAGVAFFAALAVIPAMAIAVSVYGIFTSPTEAETHVDALLEVLPETTVVALEAQIDPIADFSHLHLSIGLAFSIVALLWTASNATRALVRAVVIAHGEPKARSPLESRLASLGITLAAILIATAGVAVIAAIPVWLNALDPDHVILSFGNLRWVLVGLIVGAGVGVLYMTAPADRPRSWRDVIPGVGVATGLWILVSLAFAVYVGSFARYNETYGALGAGAILLLWFWLSTLSVIVGAQVNAIRQSRRTTVP